MELFSIICIKISKSGMLISLLKEISLKGCRISSFNANLSWTINGFWENQINFCCFFPAFSIDFNVHLYAYVNEDEQLTLGKG